jgi:hypothetical protein
MPSGPPNGLSGKGPEEAAKIVGAVDRRNYFAHTIREMQRIIFQAHGRHYHINTHMKDCIRETGIVFFERGCDIYLAGKCGDMDERAVRLTLAHELGHLAQKADRLMGLSGSIAPSPDEEVYAWVFAYHLVLFKSDMHKQDIERGKHIFDAGGLKAFMAPILRDKNPDVRSRVAEALGMAI